MAHVKEPQGVDFIIQSETLTETARQEISEFIRAYKVRTARPPGRSQADLPAAKSVAQR